MRSQCSSRQSVAYTSWSIVPLAVSILLTGCGNTKTLTSVLPSAPSGSASSYVGQPAIAPAGSTGGSLWNVTIDRSKNQFSYNTISDNSVNASGMFSTLTSDFLIFLGQNGYQNGLALELPGEAILLRAGDSTKPLVYAVQQAFCFPITGYVKFLFEMTPGLAESAFGRIYGTTTPDGKSWQFENQTEYQAPDGQNVPADTTFPGYPSGFPGNCSASNGSAQVASSPLAYFQNGASYALPTEYVVSPAGFFFENQNYAANVPAGTGGWSHPQISAWGISESPQSLPGAALAPANYVGFLEEVYNSGSYRTRVVGFGNAPISGTTMTGGLFPNEDPTQPFTINMALTFGSQDPLNNGVFYLAKLTIPYDSVSACPNPAPNQDGILSCTYNAVVVAGSPNGTYAIMLSALDANGGQKTLILFQQ